MAEEDEENFRGPFWTPGVEFTLYAKHPRWSSLIEEIQHELRCEPWQAWVVLCQLTQANATAYQMIKDSAPDRQPWETDEDEGE